MLLKNIKLTDKVMGEIDIYKGFIEIDSDKYDFKYEISMDDEKCAFYKGGTNLDDVISELQKEGRENYDEEAFDKAESLIVLKFNLEGILCKHLGKISQEYDLLSRCI